MAVDQRSVRSTAGGRRRHGRPCHGEAPTESGPCPPYGDQYSGSRPWTAAATRLKQVASRVNAEVVTTPRSRTRSRTNDLYDARYWGTFRRVVLDRVSDYCYSNRSIARRDTGGRGWPQGLQAQGLIRQSIHRRKDRYRNDHPQQETARWSTRTQSEHQTATQIQQLMHLSNFSSICSRVNAVVALRNHFRDYPQPYPQILWIGATAVEWPGASVLGVRRGLTLRRRPVLHARPLRLWRRA
jgi:hypothetical protein